MILRTIKCDTQGCTAQYTETTENKGFPGWAHMQGDFENKEKGLHGMAYLCPNCKLKHLELLNGENLNDLG